MKKRLHAVLLLVLVLMPLLSACYSYVDLDKLLYVTCILMDISDDGKPVVVFEALKPQRSSKKEANDEERITISIPTDSVSRAIDELHSRTSAEVSFAHCKVILVSMRLMESGIQDFGDIFDRRQDFISRTLVGAFDGTQKEFMETVPKEENFAGLFLFTLINNNQSIGSKGVHVDIKEMVNQSLIGDHTNSMPILRLSKDDDGDASYEVEGLALCKSGLLVGTLLGDSPTYFNLMLDNTVTSTLEVPNPKKPEKKVALQIDKSNQSSDTDFDGQTLKFTLHFNLRTTISEISGQLAPTEDVIHQLERELEDKIDENCMILFNEYKEKKTDIFDIQEAFERKYPQYKHVNIIEYTDLEVDVKVTIHGTMTKFSQ